MSVSIVSARSTASTDHAASVALPAAEADARAKSRSMASKTLDVAELVVSLMSEETEDGSSGEKILGKGSGIGIASPTTHRRRATMAPSKKGAKTQSQVVHHDEDDLIQVRDRDEARRVGDDDAIDADGPDGTRSSRLG